MKLPRDRGRPRGMYHNRDNLMALNSILLISMRYGIDSEDFFNSFVEAWQGQEATCETLLITCRKKTSNDAIFLITEGFKVVAQFSVSTKLLKTAHPLSRFVSNQTLMKKTQKTEYIQNPHIKDLKLGMKRINLKAKVIEISEPNNVFSRLGNFNTVANANIADETGTIQLPLWNQQINLVDVGDIIKIENARVTIFRGVTQLRINKNGQLDVIKKGK